MEEARRVLVDYEDRVSIAAAIVPLSTVLSGRSGDPRSDRGSIAAQDIFCRQVKVDLPPQPADGSIAR
jgi:hypothetical protein